MYPYLGEKLIVLKSVDSTQTHAKRLVTGQGIAAARTAVYTDNQTHGHGRRGKTWVAPPGANVNLTVIAHPVRLPHVWRTTFVAGVAVADALRRFAPDAAIAVRFPNDVLLNGKKVAGILVDAETGNAIPDGFALPVIGIGVNVRGTTHALPPDVAVRATTMEQETGAQFLLSDVRATILQTLSGAWEAWFHTEGFAHLLARWHDLHDPDARRTFELAGESVSCRVLSVSESGYVSLELPDGARVTVPVAHVLL